MSISEEDKTKYKTRVQKYIDGKGTLAPKWLNPPAIDAPFLEGGTEVEFTDELCATLYPFDKNISQERKFRILVALRFTSMMGGLDEHSKEVTYITEWIRQLLMFDESLRKQCGVKDWTFWEVINDTKK